MRERNVQRDSKTYYLSKEGFLKEHGVDQHSRREQKQKEIQVPDTKLVSQIITNNKRASERE